MISVIMLTYNRESMVGRAIESILNQTYRDFEYIIVDNGSDDRSGEIADAYAAKDPRIKVLHIEIILTTNANDIIKYIFILWLSKPIIQDINILNLHI